MIDSRTPEEVVWDVEEALDYPLGPNITEVLEQLVEELDERYEDRPRNTITIQ